MLFRPEAHDRRAPHFFLTVVFCLAPTFSAPKPTAAAESVGATTERVDAVVRELAAVEGWQVPGFAVAVVHEGEVVLARGYGRRSLDAPALVDAETLFAMGSTTKAFTATLLAGLVEEGKLAWDDPIHRHLPGFELRDPDLTARVTVRDLLCHRSGLGSQGNFLWYGSGLGRDEVMAAVRHLEPRQPLRAQFGYSNLGYLAAGQLIPALAAASWDDRLRSHLLDPLGLEHAISRTEELAEVGNRAEPHAMIDGELRRVPYRDVDAIAPAGGLYASAEDLAAWLRYWLPDPSRTAPAEVPEAPSDPSIEQVSAKAPDPQSVLELLRPQIPLPIEAVEGGTPPFDSTHFLAYGLGWLLQDYRGHLVAWHGGGIDGMQAQVGQLPELNLGIAVMTNTDDANLAGALFWRLADLYLGVEKPYDWASWYLEEQEIRTQRQAARAERRKESKVPGTSPSLETDAYLGTYEEDAYGPFEVRRREGGEATEPAAMVARFGPHRIADLEHWHHDTWLATWLDPMLGKSLVTFVLDAEGRAAEVRVEGIADFERQRERRRRP